MSAVMVTLRTEATEVPAVIAGSVNLLRFTEALARAGIVGRYDAARGVLVIEPVPERCRACGGTGLDDDAQCDFCGGAARVLEAAVGEALGAAPPVGRPKDNLPREVNSVSAQDRNRFRLMSQDGAEKPPQKPQERPGDALLGMSWYNGLTRQERREWHQRAGSAVPAAAWAAWKASAD